MKVSHVCSGKASYACTRLDTPLHEGERMAMKLRALSRDDIRAAVSMARAIELVKDAFAQLSAGRASVPVRAHIDVPRHEGIALFMPAYLRESDQLGMKIVSVFPRNLEAGLPTIHALVALVDSATGQPTAILDGTYLTALRTGAASGAATDLLARSDASVAAIFGAGVQGRTQLEAVGAVRDLAAAWVYDIDPAAADRFAAEMSGAREGVPAEILVASSAREAVAEADVICTTTTARSPVFDHRDLKPGAHINAVGSFKPEVQEVPAETVVKAKLVVDSREACWAETGDLIIPRDQGLIGEDDVFAELGEIVAGDRPGRESDAEITLFKSVGNAVQDVSVAASALEEAERMGLGVEITL
jgi:ornithine cyclodeaminase